MKIPVILLNYNSTADCRKCIASLKQQEGVELEIVVVDNCSTPDNRKEVERLCAESGCTFIQNDKNAGYNAGNNIGLRYAASKGYEYALIANPDMEFPQKDAISLMTKSIDMDETIVALGTDVITKEGVHQNPRLYKQQSWISSFSWITDFITSKPQSQKTSKPNWVDNPSTSHFCDGLNGCCFMVRMSYIEQIGFLDERIFLYGEEPIFAYQVKRSGMKMYYDADIQVVHDHKKSMEGNPRDLQRYWRHSRLHSIKYYSGYPWYGKLFAMASIELYFLVLRLKTIIKNK